MKAPFLWIGVATAALALGGCQKKAETPAGTAATAPAEAARPKPATVELVKEAERSASFAAVNRHLELGGTLYGYVDIDGDVVKLLGTVQGIAREVSRAQPGAAMLAFGLSLALDGNGFVAAFVCGIAFRYLRRSPALQAELALVDDIGYLLTIVMWFVVGATAVLALTLGVSWSLVLYCLLALTVVRLVPVVVALFGSPFTWPERVLVGWLGPRGTTIRSRWSCWSISQASRSTPSACATGWPGSARAGRCR